MAIPQWCTAADAAVWVPEFADTGAMGGIDSSRWDSIIQAATWQVAQRLNNRYPELVVDVNDIPDSIRQWTAIVSARIAQQAENVGDDDSRVSRLVTEELRFSMRAADGSLVGLEPSYNPTAADRVYGVSSITGSTMAERQTIYQICNGPGPMGVETFNGPYPTTYY